MLWAACSKARCGCHTSAYYLTPRPVRLLYNPIKQSKAATYIPSSLHQAGPGSRKKSRMEFFGGLRAGVAGRPGGFRAGGQEPSRFRAGGQKTFLFPRRVSPEKGFQFVFNSIRS